MKVAVIGGTRFLGRAIVDGLLARGHEVTAVHRGKTPFEREGLKEVHLDKNDRESFGRFLTEQRFDAVIDTIMSAEDLEFAIPLLEGRIAGYVHCGSTGVYAPMKRHPAREEDPCDPPNELGGYGTKLEQDRVLLDAYRERDFPCTILRPSNIYGPGDVPLDIWGGRDPGIIRAIGEGKEVIVPNDGRALIQPGYVRELGDAFSLPLENGRSIGEIYNISSQRCVTLNTYLSIMMDIMGSSSEVRHIPMKELISANRDYFGPDPRGLRFVCEHMSIDISKAERELGFDPQISLEDGMRRNLEWMSDRGLLDY